jgi:protoporphyrinogen oxidase
MWEPINRRQFLQMLLLGGSTLAFSSCGLKPLKKFSGSMYGPSAALGHKLRDNFKFPAPSQELEVPVLIVGGGIAGLSAGWWLSKQGFNNFKLLEFENSTGGNSIGGKNLVSPYPWGAHYVPIPGPKAQFVKMLFEELDVIKGYNQVGLPIYNELYLCHEPEERLFKDGRWQEGLVPQIGLQNHEHKELARFFALIQKLKTTIGNDGKPAFSIPLETSSRDPKFLDLDKLSLSEWMQQEGFVTKPLKWYLNYCCRDDFGASSSEVSAWAGIHYFAARTGKAANAEAQTVLTWPQGNYWLVQKLQNKLQKQIETRAAVYSINQSGDQLLVNYYNSKINKSTSIKAKHLIFAAPRFLAAYIIQDFKNNPPSYLSRLEYAPWLVANLTLKELPAGRGVSVAWDNVSYHSESIGYVVATHQNITTGQKQTVITYYYPLSHKAPPEARKEAYHKTYEQWAKEIINDLENIHPGISNSIENLDIWLWGHGMIKPSKGFIWGQERAKMAEPYGEIYFAHSDLSGISIFEEAQYWGVKAAQQVLKKLPI